MMEASAIYDSSGWQHAAHVHRLSAVAFNPAVLACASLSADFMCMYCVAILHAGHCDGASSPVSPRSACSTPGRTADSLRPGFRRCLPGRQHSSNDKHRFSQDSKLPSPFTGNPWVTSRYSQGASSAYSSSSSCSIVRAIASLGLDGPRAQDSIAEAPGRAISRGSISKAKKILAEAISSVPGAHGLASCASSAADTGVLSPLLTIIRNNGMVKSAADSNSRSSRSVSRRSSFSDSMSVSSSRSSFDGVKQRRVLRRSSFSEAAGGLNSDDFAEDGPCGSQLGSRSSSLSSPEPLPASPSSSSTPGQQQQKVVDCLETVRYLAMDDSNRMALIDLGAVELLLNKLQRTPASCFSTRPSSSSSNSICSAPAVMEALLSALSVLAKHDATKLRVWDNPGSAALLQLLAQRHTSPVVKAAHLSVANLAWSIDMDRSHASSGSSSVFDSVSSHAGRDDATSTTSSSCGSNVLLTPALIPALVAGLHPAANAPVLLSLLKLLNKAANSSCMASSAVSSPFSSACASDSSNDALCAVSLSPAPSTAWKVGWQQAIFALPPLLMSAGLQGGSPGRQQHVLGAVLELMITLTEQHPEFHAVISAAGCLPPLLALLLNSNGSACSELSLQAACVLHALLDCPDAVQLLGQERSMALLLQVLGDSRNSVDVRLAMLHMLRRLAAASHSCVEYLKQQGAVPTVVTLLQQVHSNDVKRTAAGLLQLLGKQVVVRPRQSRQSSLSGSDSQRSSFESASSAGSHQAPQSGTVEAAMQSLEKLALQQQEREDARKRGQHRLAQQQPQPRQTATPYYLHAH